MALAGAGTNRLEGYHPYDEAFHAQNFDDIETVKKSLNRSVRRADARYSVPYRFEPPESLRQFIAETPSQINFVLFWTPRYLTLQPIEDTPAADADTACKRQVAELAS